MREFLNEQGDDESITQTVIEKIKKILDSNKVSFQIVSGNSWNTQFAFMETVMKFSCQVTVIGSLDHAGIVTAISEQPDIVNEVEIFYSLYKQIGEN